MYSRIHHLAIIDGTGFSSYHLGEDAAEKSMDKYEERDWIYNRIIVNNTIADILGSMNTREVFCQWSVRLLWIAFCFFNHYQLISDFHSHNEKIDSVDELTF